MATRSKATPTRLAGMIVSLESALRVLEGKTPALVTQDGKLDVAETSIRGAIETLLSFDDVREARERLRRRWAARDSHRRKFASNHPEAAELSRELEKLLEKVRDTPRLRIVAKNGVVI